MEETAELPQLQLVELWTGCCMPIVCDDKCRWSMTWRSSSTVVDVPVIMDKMVDVPVAVHARGHGPDSAVPVPVVVATGAVGSRRAENVWRCRRCSSAFWDVPVTMQRL